MGANPGDQFASCYHKNIILKKKQEISKWTSDNIEWQLFLNSPTNIC